jgi:threonine synthase
VVISTANGLKFPEFKERYHRGVLPLESRYANRPVEVANDFNAVRRALDARAR